MCGIVGYIGAQQAQDILLDGLSRLEYRGYDSAGIAVMDGGVILEDAAPEEIFNNPRQPRTREFLSRYLAR